MSDKIQITDIAIERIVPSPTQPRKHFSESDLKGLTESIRQFGFRLSAPLVRPLGKNAEMKYEMVAGERRWRAAKAAGLTEIPCIVRDLSDVEVLETQLVEYVQHADLTPIEEAEHYRKLLDLRDDKKQPVHTVVSLAKRIGKDEDTVRRKLSLCNLPAGETRDAVESGLLPSATAYIVAAIVDEKARVKFAKAVLHPNFKEGPLSQREAQELAGRDYTRDLRGAPFDLADGKLVPVELNVLKERVRGGACADCPFRSGFAQKGLPSAKQNICSNPGCYDLKLAAEWSEWQKKETDPAKKRRALSREESDRIYQWGDELYHSSGLVDLSQRPDMGDLKAGETAPGTWRSLTKNRELEVIVARDKNGKTHELVSRELAIAAAKLNEHKIFRDTERERAKPENVRKEEEMERSEQNEKQIAFERAELAEIGRLATQRADFLTKEFFYLAIPLLMDVFEGGGLVWEIRQFATGPDAVQKELRKLSLKDLTGVFAQIFAESSLGEIRMNIPFGKWMVALHVDSKRIEKKVLADIAAEEKAALKKLNGDVIHDFDKITGNKYRCKNCGAAAVGGKINGVFVLAKEFRGKPCAVINAQGWLDAEKRGKTQLSPTARAKAREIVKAHARKPEKSKKSKGKK
jgi:ParB/RepB/Spo0J family partition protein